MGLTSNCTKFLYYAKTLKVDFSRTLTLGHQNLYAKGAELEAQARQFNCYNEQQDYRQLEQEYADAFFHSIGCTVMDSIDYSGYENATIIHDMNRSVPENLHQQYDAVVDGGTLEHVFNFPEAVLNCMRMVKTGGHFIAITPANNQTGHGFYQFSPELYYRVLSKENGFEVVSMVVHTIDHNGNFGNWYQVMDPADVNSRIILTNSLPINLMVIARKINHVNHFVTYPQQSDYSFTWSVKDASLPEEQRISNDNLLRKTYRTIVPRVLRLFVRNLINVYRKSSQVMDDIGSFDSRHLKKMSV